MAQEILLLLMMALKLSAIPFPPPPFILENSVLAEPRVDCGVETITVWIRTEKPFRGRLYVEDESEHPECVRNNNAIHNGGGKHNDISAEKFEGPTSFLDSRGAEFSIRFGQCNMRRQRVLNPRGVTYSFTLVISFHPFFLTGIDRAFNIRCYFMESVKALDAALDVSPLSTTVVEREFTLPSCDYHLKHGVDGPFLKYASIGQPITHVWQCDPVAGWLYGILIHSCFVDDGHGNRFDLVDDRGCVIDRSLLAEIIYDEKSFTAYAHTHVFRYADRVQIFFTCTVQLCFREDGGCVGISPPQCGRPPEFPIPSNVPHSHPPPFISPPNSQFGRSPPAGFDRKFGPNPGRPSPRHHSGPPFRGPPPFKDSPLSTNINESATGDDDKQLFLDILLLANRSRSGRNVAGEVSGWMETDLSADLTVVPKTAATGKAINGDQQQQMKMDIFDSTKKNPFVRVLPIKSDEYGGDSMPLRAAASLDSQKFSSFEVLAIAGASFVASITATSLITIFCLQRSRLRKILIRKMNAIDGQGEIIIG